MTRNNKKIGRILVISLLLLLILAITSTTVFAGTTPPKGAPPPEGSVNVIYYTSVGGGSDGGKDKIDKGTPFDVPPVSVLELPNTEGELVHVLKAYTGGPKMKLPATGGHSLLLGALTLMGLLSLGVYAYSNRKNYTSN